MDYKEEKQQVAAMAAQYLAENDWAQGSFGSDGGPRCMLGAINSCSDNMNVPCSWDLTLEFNKILDKTGLSLTQWNDVPSRTKEEVIGLLQDYAEGKLQKQY